MTTRTADPVVKEILLDAPASRVWKALTDKDDMKKWYFDLSAFRAEPGFEFRFYGEGTKGDKYLHLCKVVDVIPEKKLSYSWQYEGFEGYSVVTFELTPEGNKTKLRLTHEGLDSFPAVPDFAKENFNAGWQELIIVILKKHVEGGDA